MKAEDKNPLQRVRIAVLGNVNVGKSGKFISSFFSTETAKKEEDVQTLVAIADRKPLETNQLLTKICFSFLSQSK